MDQAGLPPDSVLAKTCVVAIQAGGLFQGGTRARYKGAMVSLALVTGTSRGIGSAVARELLARGWRVVGVARGAAPEELAHERYAHLRIDLAELAASALAFEEWSRTDAQLAGATRLGLVNNAGSLGPLVPTSELPAEELLRAHVLNAVTPVWLCGFVLRLRPELPLRIVNLSSGAATSAYPGWSAYCSGKAALRMAGAVLGKELEEVPSLRERDVRVVEYAPHVVATAMQETIRGVDESRFPRRARFVELHERGQLVAPEGPAREIAQLLERDDLPGHSERRFQP